MGDRYLRGLAYLALALLVAFSAVEGPAGWRDAGRPSATARP
jgi:hypothetical protein